MFWALLALFFLGFVFVKLGAMSVWVTVLSSAVQVLLLAAGVLIAYLGLRYWRRR
jgi:NhaP-type Na+/H+ or K+/H+ antiporter